MSLDDKISKFVIPGIVAAIAASIIVPTVVYFTQFVPSVKENRVREACEIMGKKYDPEMTDATFDDRDGDGYQDIVIHWQSGQQWIYESSNYPELKKMRQKDRFKTGWRPELR